MSNKLFKRVGVGGTFDTIHTGHIRLISEALRYGESIIIAVTSDEFARRLKPYSPRPFPERLIRLKILVEKIARNENVSFEKLDDKYGSAVKDATMDAIAVSIETLPTAFEINDQRVLRGLQPLHIIVIPLVKDGHGEKFSSRVVRRFIEEYGIL
ncbi:MAG: pantetheine-phosphate adenylyltransferase [Crenarchaeota archaeon]|nr:pantetheine-phosphate adenylyltransferase [Thermoproteota archaeon]